METPNQPPQETLGSVVLPSYQLSQQWNCMAAMFCGCPPSCRFLRCPALRNCPHAQRYKKEEKAVPAHKTDNSPGLDEAMQAALEKILHHKSGA